MKLKKAHPTCQYGTERKSAHNPDGRLKEHASLGKNDISDYPAYVVDMSDSDLMQG